MAFDWEVHRPEILRLYLKEGLTLARIQALLAERHLNFVPSTSSYRTKLREWKALKSQDLERRTKVKQRKSTHRSSAPPTPAQSPEDDFSSSQSSQTVTEDAGNVQRRLNGIGHHNGRQPSQSQDAPRTPSTLPGLSPSSSLLASPTSAMSVSPDLLGTLGHHGTSTIKLSFGNQDSISSDVDMSGAWSTLERGPFHLEDWINDDLLRDLKREPCCKMRDVNSYTAIAPQIHDDTIGSPSIYRQTSPLCRQTSQVPSSHALAKVAAKKSIDSLVLQSLIEEMNLQMDQVDSNNNTPLHVLASNGPGFGLLFAIMDKTADIASQNIYGETFLHVLDPVKLTDLDSVSYFLTVCVDRHFDFSQTTFAGISGIQAIQSKWPKLCPHLTRRLSDYQGGIQSHDSTTVAGPLWTPIPDSYDTNAHLALNPPDLTLATREDIGIYAELPLGSMFSGAG